MARFLLRISDCLSRKYSVIFLAFIWCVGLAYGSLSHLYAGDFFVSLMRTAIVRPVSIVNLLAVSLLPFLFSAVAVFLSSRFLICCVCYIKAWLFGFVSAGCFFSFGTAGWLVWLMVCFRDMLCLVILWLYWLHHYDRSDTFRISTLLACITAVFLAVSFDYCFISPTLVSILEI